MVVEASLGAALRVRAGPHAHVHGVDGRTAPAGEQMRGEQPTQRLGIDPSAVQRGIEAAPTTTARCLEAQVDGGRDGGVGVEDGVGEFEEGVGSALETFVERAAEAVESVVVGFHDVPIMHSPRAPRILYLPMELKRKLRGSANRPLSC
jgi:hypothetical protein